jgi:Ca2+-binding RTX toxin-like protein
VNLRSATAPGVGGSVSGISRFVGGSGGDTVIGPNTATSWAITGGKSHNRLVGSAQPNVLVGGLGRNILIGDAGADSLTGGGADSILIGGSTVWESNSLSVRAGMSFSRGGNADRCTTRRWTDSGAPRSQ